ncbi:YciC family protein [Virgibacillus ainsalahensis]
MDNPLRYTWKLYTGKFEKIFVLMLITTLPLLMLHSFVTNYVYTITPSFDPVYSFADIYYALLTILFYVFAQIPYIRFVYNEFKGHDHSLRNAIYQFLVSGFTIFLFSAIISIVSAIGFMFLVIPGLVLLALFFPIPYISIFDEKSIWKAYKEGVRLGKKYFFKIFLLLVITGTIEAVIGLFVVAQIYTITDSFAAQILTQMTLNLIIFPFVIMYITSSVIKWREEQEVLEIGEEKATSL